MVHKLLPICHERYNNLQIIIRHEANHEEDKKGYYIIVFAVKIVEAKDRRDCKVEISDVISRQLLKQSPREISGDYTDLKRKIKDFRLALNRTYNLNLLDKDF